MMIRKIALGAASTALLCLPGVAASANEQSVQHLTERWSLMEKTDPGDTAVVVHRAIYNDNDVRLELACIRGAMVSLEWYPKERVTPPILSSVYVFIDTEQIAIFAAKTDNGGRPADAVRFYDTGLSSDDSAARTVLEAMRTNWSGTIELRLHKGWGNEPRDALPLLSDTIRFDENEIGGVSELLLASCSPTG
jgi:hypothetical protein